MKIIVERKEGEIHAIRFVFSASKTTSAIIRDSQHEINKIQLMESKKNGDEDIVLKIADDDFGQVTKFYDEKNPDHIELIITSGFTVVDAAIPYPTRIEQISEWATKNNSPLNKNMISLTLTEFNQKHPDILHPEIIKKFLMNLGLNFDESEINKILAGRDNTSTSKSTTRP